MAVAYCGCKDVIRIWRSEKVVDIHCLLHGLSFSYKECLP